MAASRSSGLDEGDLPDLYDILYPITDKYKRFALQIKVKKNDIARIDRQYSDPSDCLMEVLAIRLKQRPALTWADVIKALKSQSVGEDQLADKIERKFGSHTSGFKLGSSKEHRGESMRSERIGKTSSRSGLTHPPEVSLQTREQRHDSRRKQEKEHGNRERESSDGCSKQQEVVEMSQTSLTCSSSVSESFSSEEDIKPSCSVQSRELESSSKSVKNGTGVKGTMKDYSCSEDAVDSSKTTEVKTLTRKTKEKKERRERKCKQEHSQLPSESEVEMESHESHETSSKDDAIEEEEPSTAASHESIKGIKRKRKRKKKTKQQDDSLDEINPKKMKPSQESAIAVCDKAKMRKHNSKKLTSFGTVDMTVICSNQKTRRNIKLNKNVDEDDKEASPDFSSNGEQNKDSPTDYSDGESHSSLDSSKELHKKRRSKRSKMSPGSARKKELSSGPRNDQKSSDDDIELNSARSEEETAETESSTATSSEEKDSFHSGYKCTVFTNARAEKSTEVQDWSQEDHQQSGSCHNVRRDRRGKRKKKRGGNGKYRGRLRKHSLQGQRKKSKHDNEDQIDMIEKKRVEGKTMSSSETDDSMSLECVVPKRLSEKEAKSLKKVFKAHYGRLCVAISDPVNLSVQLQSRALLSRSTMEKILQSPESRQSKAITLVRALQRRINGRPYKIFTAIELFLENECLEKEGREMWTETGEACPVRTATVLGSKTPPPSPPPPPPPPPSPPLSPPLPPQKDIETDSSSAIGTSSTANTYKAATEKPIKAPSGSIRESQTQVSQSGSQSSALGDYRKYLKSCYGARSLAQSDKYLPSLSAPYINLAMVSKEDRGPEERDEFTRQTLHGGIDQILSHKTPIEMKDLLSIEKVGGAPVRFVLVSGPPGIGKSTFVWELCRRWDEILGDYQIVVLLKLREKWVLNASSLSDLFRVPFQSKLSQDIAKELQDCGGRNLLLILDGFDEVSHTFHKSSVVKSILLRELLPECTIILTTRPSAKDTLMQFCQPRVDKHVEILGFTEEERVRFITEVFSKEPELQANFLKYVFLIPHLKSMMYIPLNCSIIAQVYYESQKNSNLTLPRTRTQLYKALIHSLLVRHMKMKDKSYSCMLPEGLDREDMEEFRVLAKFAFDSYHSSKSRKVTFFKEDIPERLVHFGMMNESNEMYAEKGVEKTLSFLHLSLQEYLAAWYIAHNYSSEFQMAYSMLALTTTHLEELQYRGNIEEEDDLISLLKPLGRESVVEPTIFLAGITGWRCQSKDNNLWLILINKTDYSLTTPIKCLYEAQNPAFIALVSSRRVLVPGTPYESYAISYYLAHSSSPLTELWLQQEVSIVETLVKGLEDHSHCSSQPAIQNLTIRILEDINSVDSFFFWLSRLKFNNVTDSVIMRIPNLPITHGHEYLQSLHNIQSLSIRLEHLTTWEWLYPIRRLIKLKKFVIIIDGECIPPPTHTLCWLLEQRLEVLQLWLELPYNTEYDLHSPTDITIQSLLKSVLISNQITSLLLPNISRDTMAGVHSILLHCPSLDSLELDRTRLGYDGILFICSALRKNTTLKRLKIYDIQFPQETDLPFETIERVPLPDKINCTDLVLELDDILKNNTTLETFNIAHSGLSASWWSEWTGLGLLQQFNMGAVASGRSPNLRRSFSSSDLTQPQKVLLWNKFYLNKNIPDGIKGDFKKLITKRREEGKKLCSLPSFTAPDTEVLQSFSGLDHHLQKCLKCNANHFLEALQ